MGTKLRHASFAKHAVLGMQAVRQCVARSALKVGVPVTLCGMGWGAPVICCGRQDGRQVAVAPWGVARPRRGLYRVPGWGALLTGCVDELCLESVPQGCINGLC